LRTKKLYTLNSTLLTLSDLFVTAWIVWVGVVYYGAYWSAQIGAWTRASVAVYATVLLVAALVAAIRYLRRSG
jgi:hypothetical protein